MIFSIFCFALVIITGFFLASNSAKVSALKKELEDKEILVDILKSDGEKGMLRGQVQGQSEQIDNLQKDIEKLREERQQFIIQVQKNAEEQYQKWKENELISAREEEKRLAFDAAENKLNTYIETFTDDIRKEAVKKSKEILKGKNFEQFVPFLDTSGLNPQDFHFLGMPVDYLVFNGLADGELQSIIFVEVKSGKSKLTGREKQIKQAVLEKRVEYLEFREKNENEKEI